MCHLTVSTLMACPGQMLTIVQERSMKDAAAVKILTVITLVYLPTTIVAVRHFSLPEFSGTDCI